MLDRQSIIALAAQHRLPAFYPFRYFVASGGLMGALKNSSRQVPANLTR
jgi:hypothetical protein